MGEQTRNGVTFSISCSSVISSSERSTSLALAIIRSGVTDFVNTGISSCLVSGYNLDRSGVDVPVTPGLLAWREIRTFDVVTPCLVAILSTIGWVNNGESLEPRGE